MQKSTEYETTKPPTETSSLIRTYNTSKLDSQKPADEHETKTANQIGEPEFEPTNTADMKSKLDSQKPPDEHETKTANQIGEPEFEPTNTADMKSKVDSKATSEENQVETPQKAPEKKENKSEKKIVKESKEDFQNSTFSCFDDLPLCCLGTCCGHLMFAHVVKKFLHDFVATAGDSFSVVSEYCIWMLAFSPCSVFWLRQRLREKLSLQNSRGTKCADCGVSFFCTHCALCAMAKELELYPLVEKPSSHQSKEK